VWIAEKADVVVKTDPLLECPVAPAIEAEEDCVERWVKQEDDEEDRRGQEEKDRSPVVRGLRPTGTTCGDPAAHCGVIAGQFCRHWEPHVSPSVYGADGLFARPLNAISSCAWIILGILLVLD